MNIAKSIQFVWAVLITILFGFNALHHGSTLSVLFFLAGICFLVLALTCYRDYRVSWWLSVIAMTVPLILTLPMVCFNFLMFLTGHELYRDSPGTIFVVITIAAVFNVAPILFFICLASDREKLLGILLAKRNAVKIPN